MSNQYNIFNVLYLIFRLAPIIIISFFILQSFFGVDPKGFVYLIGLCLATLATSFAGQLLSIGMGDDFQEGQSFKCNTMYLGSIPMDNNAIVEPFSKIPLSVMLYAYTFSYLFTSFIAPPVTYKNALISLQQNWTVFVLFPALMLFEVVWIMNNACNRILFIILAIIIGASMGAFWTFVIRWTKDDSLQYVSLKHIDVCSKPSKTVYRCRNINSSAKVKSVNK
jgi:hypothetical protein